MNHTHTKYVNRELSWLKFNARVLQEAADPKVPLLERLKFLGIYSNNLDEFYQVRYATVRRAIQMQSSGYNNILENQPIEELLQEINQAVAAQQQDYDRLYGEILKELEAEHIYLIDHQQIAYPSHIEFIDRFFYNQLRQSLFTLILDKKEEQNLHLDSGSLYLAVKLWNDESKRFALIDVPTNRFSRFVVLPKIGEKNYVIYLEDVIRYHLNTIFKTFDFDHITAHSVKITRDAQLDMDNDVKKSFVEKIAKSVEGRKKGEPVRIVYDRELAKDSLKLLKKKLGLDELDSVNPGGKYHNKSNLMAFPDLGRADLTYHKINPIVPHTLKEVRSYMEAIGKKDYLIYAPYHDYGILVQYLREAAIDPNVKRICLTIYRMADQSQIAGALINAARNGKQVTVVLELQARFDEAHNVHWSKILQDEGVNLIFGVPGLKVHAKVGLIQRLEGDKLRNYSIISTGNFHEKTARVYTDFTLFTAHPEIGQEVARLFEFFDANYKINDNTHLILSPLETRDSLEFLIEQEIKNKKEGKTAGINMKLNSLSDKRMIDKLYEASQAGVPVRLVVRGIHSLIPGVKGLSENIKSVSVIDKFLEHPRVYWFHNGGNDLVYISSADLMERNLDHRIELTCPIYQEDLKELVKATFNMSFEDNVKGRLHTEDATDLYQRNNQPPLRSQFATYEYIKKFEDETI